MTTASADAHAARDNSGRMVTGLFKDSESVERAYEIVAERGYRFADINVVMSDDTRRRYFSDDRQVNIDLGRKAAEGGQMGGPMGATLGTLLPALIGLGVVALPGLGLVFAGPLAVGLAAAGAAGVTVGLIAALSDWGIPDERAEQYAAGIRDGGILMGVRTRSDADAWHFEQRWAAIGGWQLRP